MKTQLSFLKGWILNLSPLLSIFIISVFFLAIDTTEDENSGYKNSASPEWLQNNSVSLKDSMIIGKPTECSPGITLTVDEIMQEEAMLPADYYAKPKPRTNPEFEIEPLPKQPNPEAPEASQWPPSNETSKGQPENQTDNPQTLGTSFLGLELSTSGALPPDSQGDVGSTQVLVCSNGRISVYSKAGILGALNSDLDVFFNSVRNGAGVTDPHIRYDRLSARWFIVAINTQAPPNPF